MLRKHIIFPFSSINYIVSVDYIFLLNISTYVFAIITCLGFLEYILTSLFLTFSGDRWTASTSITPMAGGAHLCYHHRCNDTLQVGVELEGSLRSQECSATVGYQVDIPKANLVFRGTVCSDLKENDTFSSFSYSIAQCSIFNYATK